MNAIAFEELIRRELPAATDGDAHAYGRIVAASQNTVTAVALAITRDVATSEDIAYTCHAHPTHAEAFKEAAMAVRGKPIHI